MWWRVAVFVVLCLHPVSAEPTLAQTAGYPPSTATDILRSQRAAIERNSTDTIDNGARSGVGIIIRVFRKIHSIYNCISLMAALDTFILRRN